ncbi:hypothetical protein [Actinoplanes lobatus]|uniref:Uncharacterized protein n=1 Tax=Actinoplanes lobatus TaxID=113568 RepID=A0A7W7HKH8_9ACTN|nr:hypothetical protein [Actinoplanes lobatus]MBB4751852.1 hypothetical protein [Actinoplanes lobatus]
MSSPVTAAAATTVAAANDDATVALPAVDRPGSSAADGTGSGSLDLLTTVAIQDLASGTS